ncbi:MAG: hypothetical protein AB8B91_20870 [Rubripirellula sp.]
MRIRQFITSRSELGVLKMRVNLKGCLSLLVALIWTSPLIADTPPAASGASQNMITNFKGKLKGFQRGVMTVTRDDGTDIFVQPPDDVSAFQFIAVAKPAFLGRGTMVRFTGAFNPAGAPQSAISKVEIFQPIAGKVAGHSREKFIPGVYPDRKDRGKPPQAVANYSVVGAITGLDASGAMMVQAGQRQVRVQLAPDVSLEIRVNNLSLAQEGDEVTVAGFYQPEDETKVKADRVTINTERVYGEPTKNKRTPRRRTRRTEKADEGAESAEKSDD